MTPIPINILTGFLGSGKTLLLKDLLKEMSGKKKIAVLMNEIGEISIDAKLLEGFSTKVFELNDGCICCSVNEDFVTVLDEVATKASPDLIVIETTGVANPMNILYSIINPIFVIDAVITTIDAKHFLQMKDELDVAEDQLGAADVVVITKDDLATTSELTSVEHYVRTHRPNATVFFRHALDLSLLFGVAYPRTLDLALEPFDSTNRHAHDHHHHFEHEGVEAFRFASNDVFELTQFQSALESLPKNVWRLKGVIHLEGQANALILNFAYGRYTLEDYSGESHSQCDLIFIGKQIRSIQNELVAHLKTASVLSEETQPNSQARV
ncbi:MAG: CobW family GTP-binding protein [Chloroherpetonaceae bacterium]